MRAWACVVLVAGAALATGCQSIPEDKNTQVFKRAEEYPASTFEYRIQPPDQVIVRAKNIPELDAAPRTVGPDGNVTFNLIGAVPVANLTPDELAAQLTKVMSRYYKDPDIKVEVVANSKFIYVMGPGFAQSSLKIGYTGRNTVVSAIADAGIQYDTAWPEQVTLNRPNKDPAREARITIDFTKFYEEGSLKQNFLLEEGDVIHMRHDNLTKISLGMQKVLGPLTGASTISSTGGTLVKPSGTK